MSVTINGSGTISGITSGGLGSSPIITQPELVSGVAGTGPAFSAYQSSLQTISSNTVTKVQFQTKEFDTANCFDNVTNYRFTPNVAGYYQIVGCTYFNTSLTTGEIYTTLYKNGASFKTLSDWSASTAQLYTMNGSCIVYANGSTDYFEIYIYQNTGSSKVMYAGNTAVYFQAFLARSA